MGYYVARISFSILSNNIVERINNKPANHTKQAVKNRLWPANHTSDRTWPAHNKKCSISAGPREMLRKRINQQNHNKETRS